jgi:hypothetical protein
MHGNLGTSKFQGGQKLSDIEEAIAAEEANGNKSVQQVVADFFTDDFDVEDQNGTANLLIFLDQQGFKIVAK